jgi:cytochrome c biogenesis protein
MASAQSSQTLSSTATKNLSTAIENPVVAESVAEAVNSSSDKSSKRSGAGGITALVDKGLNLLSSVPFGISLLMLLITACMIGMVIQQQELESFPGYYKDLTPGEKTVYGRLGFFDIYHVWYFNLLLLLLSLNIILASIDHFPAAWSFIAKKKLTASPLFASTQKFRDKVESPNLTRAQLVERAAAAAKATRFKVRVTEEETRTTLFVERGVWNRLGAYVVHIGLLTIFFGGFMTSRGFNGSLPVVPNESSKTMFRNVFNVDNANSQHAISQQELTLPFTVKGLDIAHKPITKGNGVEASNTLDWLTRILIDDPETGKKTEALIHMNSPFDYRGYRFFQASLSSRNSARSIKLRATPATGGASEEIEIPRDGEAKMKDGTRVKYIEFNPGFTVSRDLKVGIGTNDFENPAAHFAYVMPDGKQGEGWAFTEQFTNTISNAPMMKPFLDTGVLRLTLIDYEQVSAAHILSVQFDPGARIVYVGFTILCLTLIGIFFFSHQRLWIVVEDGKATIGGDSNRNRLGFEDRAKRLIALIHDPSSNPQSAKS